MGNSGTNWFSWIKCQQLGQVDDVRPEKKKSDVNETSEGFTSGNFFNCSLIAQISLSRNPSKGYVRFAVAHHQLGFLYSVAVGYGPSKIVSRKLSSGRQLELLKYGESL